MNKTFLELVSKIPFKVKRLVQLQNDITEQIIHIIKKTDNFNQKILAEKMGKTESYISRIVGGNVNMRLSTIVEFEEALGHKLLVTPLLVEEEISYYKSKLKKSHKFTLNLLNNIQPGGGDLDYDTIIPSRLSKNTSFIIEDNKEIDTVKPAKKAVHSRALESNLPSGSEYAYA